VFFMRIMSIINYNNVFLTFQNKLNTELKLKC